MDRIVGGFAEATTGGHVCFPDHGSNMPRYFFHRVNGARDHDHEGLVLPGLEEARYEAINFASDTLKDRKYALWEGGEVHIEVTDLSRNLLFIVFLTAENVSPQNS